MMREQRTRYAGILFYLVFGLSLLFTESGMKLVQGLQTRADLSGILFPLIALGVAFFTSEPIGFLFTSVLFFFWNVRGGRKPEFGGYAAEWRKLSYDFNSEIINRYDSSNSLENGARKGHAEEQWKEYGPDVFLSYFWQQGPRTLIDWVSRRHTAFFLGLSAIVAIALALILSTIIIVKLQMGWTLGTLSIFLISFMLAAFFGYNAQGARKEAWQMMDIWMRSAFDPQLGRALQDINGLFFGNHEKTESNLKPSFKVMRANDVRIRRDKNERRSYYFDNSIDIVVTTISKKHIELSHSHSVNTESYYVVRGRLLINVEGQDNWLNEGDLLVVNPGACHHFESTDEEVVFIAMKREPGLDDKQMC
jgi:quercetin dioxygenase-like cupin family protein